MSSTLLSEEDTRRKHVIGIEDGKLEDQLTNDKLQNLQQIFKEADEDEGGGLDIEEFRGAMRQTMGPNVSDQELDRIFMKVDTNCDGTVDWDEYLTYMLLECREKDQMQEQASQPFPRYLTSVDSEHRDSIIALKFLPWVVPRQDEDWTHSEKLEQSKGKYISVGRDGVVSVWTMDMKQTASHVIDPPLGKTNPSSQASTSVWITGCAYIARARALVFGTTSRMLLLYHEGRNSLYPLAQITGLDACPVSMAEHNPANPKHDVHARVFWGDDRGGVAGITFHQPLMKTPVNSRLSKNSRGRVPFAGILAGRVEDLSGFYHPEIHADSVSQVKYCEALECFISCSRDTDTAMFLGDIDQRTTMYYFKVGRGINDFEYFKDLNVIATGGYDAIVRVWNPYVPNKPSGMLRGHMSPIIKIHISPTKDHVISIAENKEIRVHDLNSQTCIQTFFRKMVCGLGERIISATLFQPAKHTLMLATNKLALLEHQEKDLKHKQYTSHSMPVTCALYNPLFNQVVSASTDSTVSVWDLYSGEKVMQFKAHKRTIHGESKNVEITAISFDHTYRRLLTGAQDGTVKVWNFNNGDCLRELTVYHPDLEVTGIVCSKQNIITAGWNKQITIYKDKSEDDSEAFFLKPKHKEDILTVSHYPPALVASGSYDGQIMVFSLETKRLMVKADVKGRKLYPAHGQFNQNNAMHTNSGKNEEDNVPDKSSMNTASEKPAATMEPDSDINRKIDFTRSSAVEKVLFLPTREHSKDTASLFCACADGWIRAWSAHPDGEMKGAFPAARHAGEALCALTSTSDDCFLVSGDELGYIRIWDISHFGIRGKVCSPELDNERLPIWNNYNFYLWHVHLSKLNMMKSDMYPLKLPGADVGAHLINSFRGHIQPISSLDVASPPDTNLTLILSASPDCSVRLWTMAGEFVGIFGVASVWNPAAFRCPPNNEDKCRGSSDQLTKNRSRADILIPTDVRRVASSSTIQVLFGGLPNVWKSTRGIFKWLAAFRSKKEVKVENTLDTIRQTVSVKSANSCLTRFSESMEPSLVLGSSYKKIASHKPLPKLNKPTVSGPQVRAFHLSELDTLGGYIYY